jgi:soluble epoxide hydrolase / lipid-phosphate phosphatase
MPVLFLNAQYDYVCECTHSRLPELMRTYCRILTELTIRTGHWMMQEKPREVDACPGEMVGDLGCRRMA